MSARSGNGRPNSAGRGWKIFGTVVAVVLAVGGLAAIAVVVLFVLAMNSWGSNK